MTATFYDEFLRELAALDGFARARPAPLGEVDATDPDVRRLIEAAAFFSARSRLLATDNTRDALERLAGSYFEPLVTPMPAAGLVRADVGDGLSEARFLPQGTEIRLTAGDGAIGRFATLRSMVVRPLRARFQGLDYRRERGFRVLLQLNARLATGDVAEPLRFFVNCLHDYPSSARLYYALWEHLRRVTVFYGDRPAPEAIGVPCEVSFGAAPDPEQDGAAHPLARIRGFFHFPAQNLFLEVKLPSPPREWTNAWLCVDLDDDWPDDIVVRDDSFELHVVPVVNLQRAQAVPIRCDGTRDRFDIVSTTVDPSLRVHSVRGVYTMSDAGLAPLKPAVFANSRDCFEIERVAAEGGFDHVLTVRMPSAFENPRVIVADVAWYQPDFDGSAEGDLAVSLQQRKLEGVEWRLYGRLSPHAKSPLAAEGFGLLQVMALRSRDVLGRDELVGLMEILGATDDGHFGEVGQLVSSVKTEEVPVVAARGGGSKRRYRLTLSPFERDRLPVVLDYLTQARAFLEAWSPGAVELSVTINGPVPRVLQLPRSPS